MERAALLAARECSALISLESPAGAVGWQGIGWWGALLTALCQEFPDWNGPSALDCGDATGLALAALRSGIPAIRVEAPAPVLAKIAHMAQQLGGAAWQPLAKDEILDLLNEPDPRARCIQELSDQR